MEKILSIFYDEIALKGRNKKMFLKQLRYNIVDFLRAWNINVNVLSFQGSHYQILINDESRVPFLMENLALIPGINHIDHNDLLVLTNNDVHESRAVLLTWIREYLASHSSVKSFRVTCRRADKTLPLSSMEINALIGHWILTEFPSLKVDLHTPDWEMKLVWRDNSISINRERREGMGGLPVGTAGRVVALLSGGIDSPVAAAMLMKRGAEVILCHCQNQSINMDAVQDKIQQLAARLQHINVHLSLYILPFDELQKEIIKVVPADYRMIVYKRQMLRLGELLAKKVKAKALVTGDSLSQVASQTLDNVATIYQAVDLPILSPLIGLNKNEIVTFAKKFGTFDISILPYGDCCSLLISAHPHTRSKIAEVLALEEALNLNELLPQILEQAQIFHYDINNYERN